MKYINKYKTTEEFNSALSELKKLEHYLAYDEESDSIRLKELENNSFVLNYNIDESIISKVTDSYGGQVPLITRCDLFKSIKVDGEEIDWSGKNRTPYVFSGESTENIGIELNTLLKDDSSLNTNYVLAVAPEIKQGTIEVVFQDNLNPKSLIGGFFNDISITSIPKELFEILNVVNTMSMFTSCSALTNLNLSKFDTSQVTNMNNMFASCSALTNLNLSSFDTSQVTNMFAMFFNCVALTSLDLSSFDTSQVTNMSYMFDSCSALTSLDLSSFDTSQVTNMSGMFNLCKKLNYIKCKQAFKDWCITNQRKIYLPDSMKDGGGGTWEIVDAK